MSNSALIVLVLIIVIGFTFCFICFTLFAGQVLVHIKDSELQKKSENIEEYRELKNINESVPSKLVSEKDEFEGLEDNENKLIDLMDLSYDQYIGLEDERVGASK